MITALQLHCMSVSVCFLPDWVVVQQPNLLLSRSPICLSALCCIVFLWGDVPNGSSPAGHQIMACRVEWSSSCLWMEGQSLESKQIIMNGVQKRSFDVENSNLKGVNYLFFQQYQHSSEKYVALCHGHNPLKFQLFYQNCLAHNCAWIK